MSDDSPHHAPTRNPGPGIGRVRHKSCADPVVIVGAGMAGLACALRLQEEGVECVVVDASDAPGGRVRTDRHADGFLLDRGFQVYLDAYPVTGRLLDLEALDLLAFDPGASIRVDGAWHAVHDPFRCRGLDDLWATLTAPVGCLGDKFRVGILRLLLAGLSPEEAANLGPGMTTREWLNELGFSPRMLTHFFEPFYGGVFLERDLATSCRVFRATFALFARGHACLPAGGMQALPTQLAGRLAQPPESGVRVDRVAPRRVGFSSGRDWAARAVVVATGARAAARLLGQADPPPGRSTACFYFATPEPPATEARILLTAEPEHGPLRSVAVLDRVQPSYSPGGESLVSVTTRGATQDSVDDVVAQLVTWFPALPRTAWRFLRSEHIEDALPLPRAPDPLPMGLAVAGDHSTWASLEGAVVSGRMAAEEVLTTL